MSQTSVLNQTTADVIRRAMAAAQAGNLHQACEIGEQGLHDGADAGALHAMLGLLRCRAGDLANGLRHLRAAHELQPDDATIATNLTAALVEQGDHEAALEIASLERATQDPSRRLARFRAFAAQSLSRMADAVQAYRLVVEGQPRDWEAWNNLGNALTGEGDRFGAVEALRTADRINPDSAATTLNLARSLVLVGEFDEAEDILRQTVDRDSSDIPAVLDLAALLTRRRMNYESAELLDRATRAEPNNADLQVRFGIESNYVHRPQVALKAFERALSLSPAHADAHVHLAQLLEHLNREREIPALIDRATAAGAAEGAISFMRALDHKRAGRFREGLATLDTVGSAADIASVEHLRGLFLERLGDHDGAFAAYQRMNSPVTTEVSTPEERGARYRATIQRQHDLVTPELMGRWRESVPSDGRPSPAFIVGFPRSGTTLLDTILMSHPNVEVMEEEPAIRDAGKALPDLADYPTLTDDQIQAGRDAYFRTAATLTALKQGTLLVDKNPLAMNSLPLIYRLFPDARVILALRHPCDVVLSCFITKFKMNAGMANFVRLDTTAELYDLSFRYFERARKLVPLAIHELRYEQLVEDTATELRAVCAFLGLDWTDALLDHQSTARQRPQIKTASYAQVVEPIYKRAAGRWQNYRTHLEPVLPVLKPWIETLGYTP